VCASTLSKSTASLGISSPGFNRLSVLEALRSLKARLAIIKTIPPNGLALFCGECVNADGKEELVFEEMEPYKELPHGMYRCDSRFHVDVLLEQLNDSSPAFGFVIIDGTDVTMFQLKGKTRRTLFEWSKVNLPKKHDRGGQSQNRFARIRVEKRDHYLSKVAEVCIAQFIDSLTNISNVQGLVLAGCADLKNELVGYLDPRLAKIVLAVIDVQYNGVPGFNEAIDKCSAVLAESAYVREKNLLGKFLDATRTGDLAVYGAAATLSALENAGGAVETILIADSSTLQRAVLTLPTEEKSDAEVKEKLIVYGTEEDVQRAITERKAELDEAQSLLSWLRENAASLGATMELISGTTSQGQQFVNGFGGIGGLLRYEIDLSALVNGDDENEASSVEEFDW